MGDVESGESKAFNRLKRPFSVEIRLLKSLHCEVVYLHFNLNLMNTNHSQIIRGDCLEVMAKLPSQSVDFICSDLPYNISGKGGTTYSTKHGFVPADFGEWDKWKSDEAYLEFVFQVCAEYRRLLKPNASAVLFLSYYKGGWIAYELERRGLFRFRSPIVFPKRNLKEVNLQRKLQAAFEYAVWLSNDRKSSEYGLRTFNCLHPTLMRNVMDYSLYSTSEPAIHPTQKPLEVIKRLVKIFSNPGDVVLDSFAGGGTTPLACLQTNRRYLAIEKDGRYFRKMKKRLENQERTQTVKPSTREPYVSPAANLISRMKRWGA